nr:MAG TPA: hypothetical protein [Caudoviricetes sp.]
MFRGSAIARRGGAPQNGEAVPTASIIKFPTHVGICFVLIA